MLKWGHIEIFLCIIHVSEKLFRSRRLCGAVLCGGGYEVAAKHLIDMNFITLVVLWNILVHHLETKIRNYYQKSVIFVRILIIS